MVWLACFQLTLSQNPHNWLWNKKNLQTQKWTSITASGCPTHEIGERESYRSYFSWILHNLLGSLHSLLLIWFLTQSFHHPQWLFQRDNVPPRDPHAALKIWAELWPIWKEPFLKSKSHGPSVKNVWIFTKRYGRLLYFVFTAWKEFSQCSVDFQHITKHHCIINWNIDICSMKKWVSNHY